jgi:hypothetical protein
VIVRCDSKVIVRGGSKVIASNRCYVSVIVIVMVI